MDLNVTLQENLQKDFDFYAIKTFGKELWMMNRSEVKNILGNIEMRSDTYEVSKADFALNWKFFASLILKKVKN